MSLSTTSPASAQGIDETSRDLLLNMQLELTAFTQSNNEWSPTQMCRYIHHLYDENGDYVCALDSTSGK